MPLTFDVVGLIVVIMTCSHTYIHAHTDQRGLRLFDEARSGPAGGGGRGRLVMRSLFTRSFGCIYTEGTHVKQSEMKNHNRSRVSIQCTARLLPLAFLFVTSTSAHAGTFFCGDASRFRLCQVGVRESEATRGRGSGNGFTPHNKTNTRTHKSYNNGDEQMARHMPETRNSTRVRRRRDAPLLRHTRTYPFPLRLPPMVSLAVGAETGV